MRALKVTLAALTLVCASSSGAAVLPIQRADIVSRAEAALGFSYYWGHGSWSPGLASSAAGSCTGNCPSCTHAGRYGADCSGYAVKVWELPSTNADVTVDSHPYSTADLINAKAGYWGVIADADLKPGDARVYRSASEGHVYLIKEVTGAGRFTTLEAKGCAYGILSLTRSDDWVSQRRAQVVEPVAAPPDTPEQPNGPTTANPGIAATYCTRATAAQGGMVTDALMARSSANSVVASATAPAALAGAEMCLPLVFPSVGTFQVTAKASNAAGSSAESTPLSVVVVGSSDGGTGGGSTDAGHPDAGSADGGSDAGNADAGSADAGSPDAGQPDAGPPVIDGGDEGDPINTLSSKSGCGGCGGGSAQAPALLLLALWAARRRKKAEAKDY